MLAYVCSYLPFYVLTSVELFISVVRENVQNSLLCSLACVCGRGRVSDSLFAQSLMLPS